MLYEIKVLKAPWPVGAKVGDVVDMPYLPVWAQGKCSIAVDGAEPTIEFVEPVAADGVNRPLGRDVLVVNPEMDQARRDLAEARGVVEHQAGTIDRLTHELRDADAGTAELRAKLEAAESNAATLQAKLDATQTDDGKAAAALKEADAQADLERAAAETKAATKGKGK